MEQFNAFILYRYIYSVYQKQKYLKINFKKYLFLLSHLFFQLAKFDPEKKNIYIGKNI